MRKFDKAGMFMDNLVSEEKVAGCSVKVVLENKVVYEHYTGYADLKDQIPIEETTLFRIYSMTKPVTVTAALQLYEQGKFLLNDPVAEYLPEFKEMQVCIPEQKGG